MNLRFLRCLAGCLVVQAFIPARPAKAADGSWSASAMLPRLSLAQATPATPLWTADQLDQLLAPIALYPDPLLALILPASTEIGDLEQAAAALESGATEATLDAEGWEACVAALTHYPTVLEWMDQNIEWTTELGQAYLNQPSDVVEAVQRLRSRALAAGALVDTAQQRVVVVNGEIEILPAQTDVFYVPIYNPLYVFGAPPYGFYGPLVTFGPACPVGPWLSYGWDWGRRQIWVGHWQGRPWAGAQTRPPDARRWQPRTERSYAAPPAGHQSPSAPGGSPGYGQAARLQGSAPGQPQVRQPHVPSPYYGAVRSQRSGSQPGVRSQDEPARRSSSSSSDEKNQH